MCKTDQFGNVLSMTTWNIAERNVRYGSVAAIVPRSGWTAGTGHNQPLTQQEKRQADPDVYFSKFVT